MKLSLVVPVYNEELAIPVFLKEVNEKLSGYDLEIIFINDGSSDNTGGILSRLAYENECIVVVNFSRNFGKEPALFAGLKYSTGDVIIPIDVDLQDPIEVIPELVKKWQDGFEVVLAKRVDRSSDSFFKRKSAEWFYSLHNAISSPKIENNVGDFRLMDKKVVNNIVKHIKENNLFMKGILSWVGFKTTIVEYQRKERSLGDSKFNAWKLWNLALEGITSFSTLPLRLWTYLGFMCSGMSFFYGLILIIKKIFFGISLPGYPSLIVSILFTGGAILMGIGVLGEYMGRIYMEVKQRPKFIVSTVIKNKELKDE